MQESTERDEDEYCLRVCDGSEKDKV